MGHWSSLMSQLDQRCTMLTPDDEVGDHPIHQKEKRESFSVLHTMKLLHVHVVWYISLLRHETFNGIVHFYNGFLIVTAVSTGRSMITSENLLPINDYFQKLPEQHSLGVNSGSFGSLQRPPKAFEVTNSMYPNMRGMLLSQPIEPCFLIKNDKASRPASFGN